MTSSGALERAWNQALEDYSLFTITTVFSSLVHLVFFFAACALPFSFQFVRALDKYRIQPISRHPDLRTQWYVVGFVLASQLFVQFPLILGNYVFVVALDIPVDFASIPSAWSLALRLGGCLLVEDTWHYFAHRTLHHPRLYKHIHKMHHKYTSPFGFATEYAHPVETVILGMGFFWGLLLFCNHVLFMWMWLVTRLGISIDQHCGYDIPLNPLKLLPGYAGPRHHDFHHETFNSNFSSTFVWWDRLFNTDAEFRKHLEHRRNRAKHH